MLTIFFCIDRAWKTFSYLLNKLIFAFNLGSSFYFLLDSLFWVLKIHREPPAGKPHAHVPYHISGGKCTTVTIPLLPLREVNLCTFRDQHISVTSWSSKGEICKKHQVHRMAHCLADYIADCISWHNGYSKRTVLCNDHLEITCKQRWYYKSNLEKENQWESLTIPLQPQRGLVKEVCCLGS